MQKEVWDEEAKAYRRHRRGRDRSTRRRRCGRARSRRSPPSSTRSSTSTSRTTPSRRSPGRTPGSRAAPSTRSCSTSRRGRRSTCGTASTGAAQALRAARVHHGRRRAAAAGATCASCAASSTPTTCRSTSRARSCRSRATSRRSAAAASSACSTLLEDLAENEPEKYATFWTTFGRVLKEGIAEDHGQPRPAREAAALRLDARRRRRAGRVARRLRRAHEGRPGGDLLRHRRDATPRRRNSPHLEIFRKKGIEVLLLSDRIDEWVASAPAPSSRASRCTRSPAARSTSARWPTAEEKAQQEKEAGGDASPWSSACEGARRTGQGSARHPPPDRLAGVPRRRRRRRLGQPRAAAEGRRAEGADRDADPRGQSAPRAGPAPDDGVRRAARRLGAAAVRPGAARRGRAARRPRGVRAARSTR